VAASISAKQHPNAGSCCCRRQQPAAPAAASDTPSFSLWAAVAPAAQLALGMLAVLQAFMRRWAVRAGLGASLLLLGLHLLLKTRLLLPLVNHQVLPGLLLQASAVTMRQVGGLGAKQ